jgi:hypothetical protein
MQLLGHKDIRMTLRYVEVTQQDLQREFHQARQNAGHSHRVNGEVCIEKRKKLWKERKKDLARASIVRDGRLPR